MCIGSRDACMEFCDACIGSRDVCLGSHYACEQILASRETTHAMRDLMLAVQDVHTSHEPKYAIVPSSRDAWIGPRVVQAFTQQTECEICEARFRPADRVIERPRSSVQSRD